MNEISATIESQQYFDKTTFSKEDDFKRYMDMHNGGKSKIGLFSKWFGFIVIFISLLVLSLSANAAWVTEPVYYLKRVSTGGSVTYRETTLAIGNPASSIAPIAKTEKTASTTWIVQPTYLIKRVDGSKVEWSDSGIGIVFISDTPPTPKDPLCEIQEAMIYDPAFKGFRLLINKTPQDPDPCYYARLVKQPSGDYQLEPYSAKQPDGSCR